MEKIRDYNGRSERRAEQIQSIIGSLGQVSALPVTQVLPVIERTDVTQLGYTMQEGWDSEGRYTKK